MEGEEWGRESQRAEKERWWLAAQPHIAVSLSFFFLLQWNQFYYTSYYSNQITQSIKQNPGGAGSNSLKE